MNHVNAVCPTLKHSVYYSKLVTASEGFFFVCLFRKQDVVIGDNNRSLFFPSSVDLGTFPSPINSFGNGRNNDDVSLDVHSTPNFEAGIHESGHLLSCVGN